MKNLIKELRDLTGAGFAECKRAAEASAGDLNAALLVLRSLGIAKAGKKAANEVEHGSILIQSNEVGNLVVLNFRSQTDFAVKSDAFCKFVENEAHLWLNSDSASLEEVSYGNESFQDRLSFFLSTLGENVILNQSAKFLKKDGIQFVYYLHNKINSFFENVATQGVVLTLNEGADLDAAMKIAKHAVAADSLVLSEQSITSEMLAEISDVKDRVLLNQDFFYDESMTVKAFAEKNEVQILDFALFLA